MKRYEYRPQSNKWNGYAIFIADDMASAYESGKGTPCSLMVAQDGNTTLVKAEPGNDYILRSLRFSGVCSIVRGEGEIFLASSGSWSGGSNNNGAIALKPGAIMRLGAKGSWSYLVADEDLIRAETHDPRLFEVGSSQWKPLG